ncbi:hypothetical protein OPV22_003198 [Ensete ventricosum]|uniref:Uncharacterized protein n=1 Tax=Ensete ventricosum TaxID=4639 RepID=A0AAV8S054_ENSVE|nr:hypothetical protein OPV22_003198 [Ensete ventricosum]RWW04919.1 hypothetical protein GW17_00031830 [Ensete ventricosum]
MQSIRKKPVSTPPAHGKRPSNCGPSSSCTDTANPISFTSMTLLQPETKLQRPIHPCSRQSGGSTYLIIGDAGGAQKIPGANFGYLVALFMHARIRIYQEVQGEPIPPTSLQDQLVPPELQSSSRLMRGRLQDRSKQRLAESVTGF